MPDRPSQTSFGAPAPPDTLAERRRYLTEGYTAITCGHCGTEVSVRKNSSAHTSIQWTGTAECPERNADSRGCPRLRTSIAHAVTLGVVPVGDAEHSAAADTARPETTV
jgi:hypothetical protein